MSLDLGFTRAWEVCEPLHGADSWGTQMGGGFGRVECTGGEELTERGWAKWAEQSHLVRDGRRGLVGRWVWQSRGREWEASHVLVPGHRAEWNSIQAAFPV